MKEGRREGAKEQERTRAEDRLGQAPMYGHRRWGNLQIAKQNRESTRRGKGQHGEGGVRREWWAWAGPWTKRRVSTWRSADGVPKEEI